MWIKSIYGKADLKRLKLYICRVGRGLPLLNVSGIAGCNGEQSEYGVGVGVWYIVPSFFFFNQGIDRFKDLIVDGPCPAMIGRLAYMWNLLFFAVADPQPRHTVLEK